MDDHVHKWLVEALGEVEGLSGLGRDGWLPGPQWAAAVERTRVRKYAALAPAEGAWRVGRDLGTGFLESDIGKLVRETLPLLTLDRVMELLFPQLTTRLRRDFELTWERTDDGGLLRITGPIATAPETTLGFFEAALSLLAEKPRLAIVSTTPRELVLRITRS